MTSAIGLAIRTALEHWRICLAVSAPYAVLTGLTNAVTRSSSGIVDPTILDTSQVAAAGVEALLAMGMMVLINIFIAPVTVGALSLVGSATVYEDSIDSGGVARRALDRALDAVAAAVLSALLLGVPLLVVALIATGVALVVDPLGGFAVLFFGSLIIGLPVLYAFVRMSLAVPVVMREGGGPIQALRRSWQLVRGSWWWVFATELVALFIGSAIVFVSFRWFLGRDTLVDIIVGGFVTTAAAAVAITLYGVATGIVYAIRAPEDTRSPEVAAAEERAASYEPFFGYGQPQEASPPPSTQ